MSTPAWAINRLAVDCIERCSERQTEVWGRFSSSMLNLLGVFGAQAGGHTPSHRNAPALVEIIDLTLDHMHELSEIIARANQEGH